MALRKTDKIIAVIGAIILIVAAVGIYMYLTQKEEETPKPPQEKYYSYKVVVDVLSSNETPRKSTIKDKIIGNDTVTEAIEPPADLAYRLRNISVYVEYKDKRCGLFGFGRLMKSLGRDTLSVDLLDSNGKVIDRGTIGGREGTENLTLKTADLPPLSIATIEAKSSSEAQRMLDENITADLTNITYQIQLKLDQKESPLRPIMWLLEKLEKDEYTITVTYYYYDYSIEKIGPKEVQSSGSQYKEEGSRSINTLSKFYLTLGLPGRN